MTKSTKTRARPRAVDTDAPERNDEVQGNGQQLHARLVRGRHYVQYWRGEAITFLNGVWVPIQEEMGEYLEQNAFDKVSLHDGDDVIPEVRKKFEFEMRTNTQTRRAEGVARRHTADA